MSLNFSTISGYHSIAVNGKNDKDHILTMVLRV